MPEKITVILVDDHKLVAESWAALISANPKFTVLQVFNDTTEETMEKISNLRPAIVIMDINIPPLSGIDAVPVIRKLSPGTRVVGVSMHNQPSFAKRMLRNGASGYVTKSSHMDEVFLAMDTVSRGGTYICKEIQEKLTNQIMVDDQGPDISKLTERELEVLKLVKEGFSSKEIAEKLFLSTRTIEAHRSFILKKLNIKNTPALMKFISDSTSDL
jgi:DNA-binding NarL/FixJ family response regulator